jgi:hypothetical protein
MMRTPHIRNRRTGMQLSREEKKAPSGQFRVIGETRMGDDQWIEKDFDSENEALRYARENINSTQNMRVYDDTGKQIYFGFRIGR